MTEPMPRSGNGASDLFSSRAFSGLAPRCMQHWFPRSLFLIECAKAGVDPRTVRKMLSGKTVRPFAAERAARVIARLNLTPEMLI
jgi:hypothetical protein